LYTRVYLRCRRDSVTPRVYPGCERQCYTQGGYTRVYTRIHTQGSYYPGYTPGYTQGGYYPGYTPGYTPREANRVYTRKEEAQRGAYYRPFFGERLIMRRVLWAISLGYTRVLFPFHCWAVIPTPVFNVNNTRKARPWAHSRPLFTTRFTVRLPVRT